jgi:hypothetical protein
MAEAQTVDKGAKSMEADVGHHLVSAGFHLHADGAVSFHLAGALLTRVCDASTTSESLVRRALPRMVGFRLRGLV